MRGLESLGSPVVGLRVTEPAPTVACLGNDGSGAFARVKAAATAGAVRVALAGACDELRALLGWLGGALVLVLLSLVLVLLAFLLILLAFLLVVLALLLILRTLLLVVLALLLVLGALLGSTASVSLWRRVSISDTIALPTRENSISSLNSLSSLIVRLGIAEPTSAVPLLSDDGTGALAGVETTAFGRAVGIGFAWPRDELRAGGCAGDVGRCDGESEVKSDKDADERNGNHDDDEAKLD